MNKVTAAKKLIRSKCYILITDVDATMAGDFTGFDGMMKLHSLQMMKSNLNRLIKDLSPKGKTDGRKQERTTVKKRSGSRGPGRPRKSAK